jgi:hypothetical protein
MNMRAGRLIVIPLIAVTGIVLPITAASKAPKPKAPPLTAEQRAV